MLDQMRERQRDERVNTCCAVQQCAVQTSFVIERAIEMGAVMTSSGWPASQPARETDS